MTERFRFDGVLIVGAGLAGLSAALAAAPRKTMVLSAGPLLSGCSSAWAQGGIAAALGEDDSPKLHAADTVAVGAGLVDPKMALLMTREGPDAVRRLAALGVPFDRDDHGGFVTNLEAAHSRSRVARVKGDQAGREIMRTVAAAAMAEAHVEIRPNSRVRALVTDDAGRVRGALVEQAGVLTEIIAPATILATGGLGGLYALTTNPRAVTGEGLALAALVGARIADPEFVQFHPTAIALDADPAPLASESLRGERAVLVDGRGPADHGRPPPARRPRSARRRGAGDPRADPERRRRLPRCPRGDRRALPATSSPPSSPPAWPAASIRASSRSRSPRPPTTTWAG